MGCSLASCGVTDADDAGARESICGRSRPAAELERWRREVRISRRVHTRGRPCTVSASLRSVLARATSPRASVANASRISPNAKLLPRRGADPRHRPRPPSPADPRVGSERRPSRVSIRRRRPESQSLPPRLREARPAARLPRRSRLRSRRVQRGGVRRGPRRTSSPAPSAASTAPSSPTDRPAVVRRTPCAP